ncbi:MAG: HmuY family protein [Candidatus Poseidoniaceae archaeon]|nr:HmuY family protein [Candidatus Poseidoniaceae archaeon]
MSNWLKRVLAGVLIVLLIGAGGWYLLVTSYSAELTTENEILVEDYNENVSNQSNDPLFQLSFSSGEDNLDWSKLTMSLKSDENRYDCTKSGLTSSISHNGLIQTRLNSDGNSFTIEANSDSDDFIFLSFTDMQQTNDSNYSISFSKTDIILGENVSGYSTEEEFQNVDTIPDGEPTETSDSRLEWYDYDISVHRVIPKEITYIVNDSNMFYKIQFLSYYNSDDDSRYISFIISSVGDTDAPAINNENLTKEAHCIISSDNESVWNYDEIIYVSENGHDICSSACNLEIEVRYLNQIVKGTSEVKVE